jgi:hypothetical protein
MAYAEHVAAAVRIAALPSPEARRDALSQVPPDFQALVRETAASIRAVALHWRRRAADGHDPAGFPDAVRATLAELWPGEFRVK